MSNKIFLFINAKMLKICHFYNEILILGASDWVEWVPDGPEPHGAQDWIWSTVGGFNLTFYQTRGCILSIRSCCQALK